MSLSEENLVDSSGTIPKLEQTSQWLTWKREMLDLLDMCGYGDLLTRNAQPPTEGNDPATQFKVWRSRQDRACGAIRSRLGYNARVFTTGIPTAQDRGTTHFVNKFLCGLGPDYEVFLTAFNQNHNILPIRDPNNRNVILKEAVTFEKAIFAASQEEDRQRGATARIAHRVMVAQGTPCCGDCGRKGHDRSTCWKFHPELRRERSKAGYERRQRKMQSREKTTDELESATYATPAYLQPDQARLVLWQNDFQGHLGLIGSSFGPSCLQASLQARALERIHVFDSGASSHIFCRHENFTDLQKYYGLLINGIVGAKVMPGGCGTALYVPEGHSNLLSVSALEKKGAEVVFRNGKAVVTNKGKIVLTATRVSGVYVVDEAEEDHFQTALASFRWDILDCAFGTSDSHIWERGISRD
ncbi:hypothetical protein IL306_013259 [Fusarium sp. DS 682]|nr:hypothetical protein IL306_013259 [Fusarium sp. DS 682]